MGKKSQIWSMDGLIATVIFVAAISAFIILISLNLNTNKLQSLKDESKLFPKLIENPERDEFAIVKQNKVDFAKVKELQDFEDAEGYARLKSSLGLKNDFCIYFEDDKGYLINMSHFSGSTSNDAGLGSSDVVLTEDGITCS